MRGMGLFDESKIRSVMYEWCVTCDKEVYKIREILGHVREGHRVVVVMEGNGVAVWEKITDG